MAIRVVHIGTGNVGRLALSELVANPAFELTGLVVSADEKVGRDAGELAGLDVVTGITATKDLDAALATNPDCAVYCAMGDNRMPQAMADVYKIAAAGINVVGTSPVCCSTLGVMPDKYIGPWKRLRDRAIRASTSTVWIRASSPT